MNSVKTIVVGPYEENCYLFINEKSKEAVIIDPGAEPETIAQVVDREGVTPKGLLLTHGHGDHIGAVNEMIEKYKLPLYVGKEEVPMLADPILNLSAALGLNITTPPPDFLLEDEQIIQVAGFSFRILSTPGHSVGGLCYLCEESNDLFTGDTLFYGSIGRTDFPGCSVEQLLDSINNKLMRLPDSIKCYPGHGPQTTIGGERRNNPFLTGEYFA